MIRVLVPLVLLLAACTTPVEDEARLGRGPITFVDGRDTSAGGQVAEMVERWNERATLREQVTFLQMPASTDAHRAQLTARAQDLAGVRDSADCFDVMAVDMVWTAEFAAAGHLEPLDSAEFGVDRMLPRAVEAAKSHVDGRMWAIPWRTDVGLLYYRADVLAEEGVDPPTTWAELRRQATEFAPGRGLQGYVGQLRRYEGLVVNVAESIWAHGGDLERPAAPETKAGVRALADGIAEGWVPREALAYEESQSLAEFQAGRALFLRNWPYAGPVLAGPGSPVAGKWAAAPLPGPSALGGWNLAVSRCSAHQQTARDFIEFVTGDENQRVMFERAGFLPTSTSLYREPGLSARLGPLRESLAGARTRPTSAHYDELTSVMQENLHHALQNPEAVDGSLDLLAEDLARAAGGR
ncbi:ABC transporter substrate-binding protein [Saccharothrix hoggarensis]|uniref:ABC transporter substrate-binding protein n=1 Tax=Saccharothrix hoggarensis TaxID=913853 RepID=A0ABW3R4D5_9PSEU